MLDYCSHLMQEYMPIVPFTTHDKSQTLVGVSEVFVLSERGIGHRAIIEMISCSVIPVLYVGFMFIMRCKIHCSHSMLLQGAVCLSCSQTESKGVDGDVASLPKTLTSKAIQG